MSLKVLDDLCCRREGKLVIVVEGENPEEVTGQQAKKLAIEKAAECGYVHAGFNNQSGSYPVGIGGEVYDDADKLEKLQTALAAGAKTAIVGYRNDIVLMPRL